MVRVVTIVVAVILMIVGGTVGIMKQLEMGPFAPDNGVADQTAAADPAEPPRFLDMDPLIIPLFAGDTVAGRVQIQIKLETKGAENEEFLTHVMPRLSDAFLRELYAYLPRVIRKQGNIDVFLIKRRLQLVADKTAGEGRIDNILIQSVTEAGVSN
jgi:hypothetical protein